MICRVSGDRSVRGFDPTFESKGVVGIRRLEVITGVGGRRVWLDADKGRITPVSADPTSGWRLRASLAWKIATEEAAQEGTERLRR
jgi:hypothetical protein